MKKANVLLMSYDEFNDLVGLVSDGEAGIANELGDWFYVSTEQYNLDEMNTDLSNHLGSKVVDVLIDLTNENDCVAVVLE